MISLEPFDAIVVGAGPTGMVAALQLSKQYQTALIAQRAPLPDHPPRVEAVPAAFLALLLEFGIQPKELGVDRLYDSHVRAWDTALPVSSAQPVMAHIGRPALDLALFRQVSVASNVRVLCAQTAVALGESAGRHVRSGKTRWIDASGRRALSAASILSPSKPWRSRTFWSATGDRTPNGQLMIAALPDGYMYRLGNAHRVGLGIISQNRIMVQTSSDLQVKIRPCGAEWILEGLPPLEQMTRGKTSLASVQWAVGNHSCLRIGDAALARDPLSSQGLSCGVSEALYAACLRDPIDEALFLTRQGEQRALHLQSLKQVMARCRFRTESAWSAYSAFLDTYTNNLVSDSHIALRYGYISSPVSVTG